MLRLKWLIKHVSLANRKERPISLGIFPLPPGDALLTPETQREAGETPGSEQWKFHELSQPRSHTSLKVSKCVAYSDGL